MLSLCDAFVLASIYFSFSSRISRRSYFVTRVRSVLSPLRSLLSSCMYSRIIEPDMKGCFAI